MTEESIYGPSDLAAWNSAYTTAQMPAPKAAEMLEALDEFLAREKSYARVTALCNGGEFDAARLRRIAALEAAYDTIARISEAFVDFPKSVQKTILGTGR